MARLLAISSMIKCCYVIKKDALWFTNVKAMKDELCNHGYLDLIKLHEVDGKKSSSSHLGMDLRSTKLNKSKWLLIILKLLWSVLLRLRHWYWLDYMDTIFTWKVSDLGDLLKVSNDCKCFLRTSCTNGLASSWLKFYRQVVWGHNYKSPCFQKGFLRTRTVSRRMDCYVSIRLHVLCTWLLSK